MTLYVALMMLVVAVPLPASAKAAPKARQADDHGQAVGGGPCVPPKT
jgi:hypothetical protein